MYKLPKALLSLLLASFVPPLAAQTPEIDSLRAEADSGNADSLNELASALIFEFAEGLDEEQAENHPALVEARELLERAAALGDADSMSNLATMYAQGLGGPVNLEASRAMLYRAAEAGSSIANIQLSEWYERGTEDFDADPQRSRAYMLRAAETGDPYAQWRYAMLVLQGVGEEPDPDEAYRWIVLASEQGGTRAMTSRGVMLATGEGVAEDDVAAREWYRRAAESGNVTFDHALKGLGLMLLTGEGGPVDRPLGYAYASISAAAGNQEGVALRNWAVERLTDAEIARGDELANEWVALHLPIEPDQE